MKKMAEVPIEPVKGETKVTKRLTLKQAIIVMISLPVAIGIASAFPLPWLDRLVVWLSAFAALALPAVIKHKDQPLYTYARSTLSYRLTPKTYVKAVKETSLYPPTQNWLGIKDVVEDVVVKDSKQYFTGLKVGPVDVGLRPGKKRDLIYAAYTVACSTLDFYYQIVVDVQPYDAGPYTSKWEEISDQYPTYSEEEEYCRLNAESFSNRIKAYKIPKRCFYLLIPVNLQDLAPEILEEEKIALRAEKDRETRSKLREEYEKRKLEIATEELRIRKASAMSALQAVDPKLKVEEMKGQELKRALRMCMGGT